MATSKAKTVKKGAAPRRSTGRARAKKDGMLPNGKPDLSPTAGYAGNEPVQYADETAEQFAMRKHDFEARRKHAEEIENGDNPSVVPPAAQ